MELAGYAAVTVILALAILGEHVSALEATAVVVLLLLRSVRVEFLHGKTESKQTSM